MHLKFCHGILDIFDRYLTSLLIEKERSFSTVAWLNFSVCLYRVANTLSAAGSTSCTIYDCLQPSDLNAHFFQELRAKAPQWEFISWLRPYQDHTSSMQCTRYSRGLEVSFVSENDH